MAFEGALMRLDVGNSWMSALASDLRVGSNDWKPQAGAAKENQEEMQHTF